MKSGELHVAYGIVTYIAAFGTIGFFNRFGKPFFQEKRGYENQYAGYQDFFVNEIVHFYLLCVFMTSKV